MQQNYSAALIDAHVHIYDCFDIRVVLDSAWNNFQRIARTLAVRNNFIGVFLLTETSSDNRFQALAKVAGTHQQSNTWQFAPTKEDCSLLAVGNENQALVLVAGRQIVTKENLEVLALGTTQSFQDQLSINQVLKQVRDAHALTVLPWGFGKWLAGRGKIVESLLESRKHPELFLGDNSGRLGLLPRSRLFAKAVEQKIVILPGSDPLPFTREMSKPGSFGCILSQPISMDTPAGDIKKALTEPKVSISPFGRAEYPFRFVRNQVAMQFRRYIG